VKAKGIVTSHVDHVHTAWHPSVNLDLVTLGVKWLAENWALSSEPMVPKEILVTTPKDAAMTTTDAVRS